MNPEKNWVKPTAEAEFKLKINKLDYDTLIVIYQSMTKTLMF
jgi:hypothetical protein